jgi:hypothetical protein
VFRGFSDSALRLKSRQRGVSRDVLQESLVICDHWRRDGAGSALEVHLDWGVEGERILALSRWAFGAKGKHRKPADLETALVPGYPFRRAPLISRNT